jgi:hypothetical protein
MTEFLWIALGLGLGLVVGYLVPRGVKPKRSPQGRDEAAVLRGQLGRAQTDVENARLEVARAQSAREAAEAQVKELQVRLPRLEGFERANADLRLQLQGFDAVKSRLETATKELEGARPQLAESQALAARLEGVQAELSALKTRTAGFEGLQERATQAADLEGRLSVLEAEKAKLVKDASDAVLKASDAEAAQRKLRSALDEAIADVARTRDGVKRFEALKERIDELEAREIPPEVQGRIEGLERDLEAAKQQAAALEGAGNAVMELQQTQLRVLDLERQVATLPGLKDQLHDRNADLTAARDRLGQLDGLSERVKTLEEALASREAELERLRVPQAPSEG